MRESPVMGKAECSSSKTAQDVEIGRFRSQRESKRGERRLAIEPGAPHTRAGQKVCDWFQAVNCILFHLPEGFGASSVNASGTTEISAGRLPINSPSAST